MLRHPLLSKQQEQDPFQHIGKSTGYRSVERRAGVGGTRRKRRSRKDQHRKGNGDEALIPGKSTEEANSHSGSLDQCNLVAHTAKERPVYWKLLQMVLANLGLTEEQWRAKYVDQ